MQTVLIEVMLLYYVIAGPSWQGLGVQVGHVFRKANKCIDFLGKRDCSMMENFIVFDTSPSSNLNVLLDTNINELYYYRHVTNTLVSVASL